MCVCENRMKLTKHEHWIYLNHHGFKNSLFVLSEIEKIRFQKFTLCSFSIFLPLKKKKRTEQLFIIKCGSVRKQI